MLVGLCSEQVSMLTKHSTNVRKKLSAWVNCYRQMRLISFLGLTAADSPPLFQYSKCR